MKIRLSLAAFVLLCASLPSRAGEPDGVQRAIDNGVAYLKSTQQFDGTWPYNQIGPTALAGLTLLECGVPADDPAVQKAAGAVREAALTATQTYSLALSILFLDRLGEAADVFLIESMTVRLLAGQNNYGGWTYECHAITDQEVRRLTTLLRQRNELVASKELPKPGTRRTEKDLPKEIQQQLAQIKNVQGAAPGAVFDHGDDNSNTQFAVLGLWVAHRHGLPVETALSRVNKRFRSSQAPDGGWGYKYYPTNTGGPVRIRAQSTATMTCSALLGLGVSQGYTNEVRDVGKAVKPKNDPTKDLVIRNGLYALGSCIDHPLSAKKGRVRDIRLLDSGKGRQYYFLWSLERVAVAYGLKTLGGKDWYAWGCEILLAAQERDGSWRAKFADAGCDTCFALLFLRRANLAKDLSAALTGMIQDPGEIVLKGAGVAGENLAGIGLKPPEPGDKDDEAGNGPPARAGGGKPVGGKPPALPLTPEPKPAAETGTPPAGDAQGLSAGLLRGSRQQQEQALEKLRDSKGSEYTQALADAIPKLDGAIKSKARETLADRLVRMTAKTLGEKLDDDAPEVRRAAALACAMKDDKTHLRRLIELLEDKESAVARAAYAALKSLSGRDFGPSANASPAEVRQAVSAWRDWWSKQGK
jgi:hypothetical protein